MSVACMFRQRYEIQNNFEQYIKLRKNKKKFREMKVDIFNGSPMGGSRNMAKITSEVFDKYTASLYSKICSPSYCCEPYF